MKQVEIISKVVGRGESEGITSAIPSINLSGFALKSDLLTLEKKFSDFLNVPIIDGTINRWNELETFLAGISEDYNLLSLLNGKADKSYVDTNFVTIATKQTITGEKNFTGGLKVNGSPIYYDATNKYWKLEGDLLVTGGVSMYSDDSEFTPSTIMDGVVVDGTSIRKNPTTGALEVIGGSGATVKYPLSWSGFNQGSYDGSVAQSFYIPTKLSEFVNDKSFATTSDLSGYMPLSGGQMSGHIYMTGAKAASSIDNTSQIVFGTPSDNHVCITSNRYGIIINRSLSDTSNQIGLYADADSESFIQSSLKVYGNLYASVFFNYGGSIAQSYGSSMYVWDNALQINKTTSGNGYLKTIMSFDLINENIALKINGKLSLNSYVFWNSDSNNPYMCISYGGRDWYLQAYNNSYIYLGASITTSIRIDTAGNLLTSGGITMYSDIRKKTKLQDVELSLKQIADAPLIEHYYNSDAMRTTHVGSIAQYWAGLNDWFCKLDNEGFYTMEIQNCALASAISIARHLEKYETKTDKKIRQLKKRISQLEDELELLKKGV